MSEEEKKAIELFNSYINAIDTFGTIDYKCINNLYEPAKTVLNLVKKQQEEIEFKNDIIKHKDKVYKITKRSLKGQIAKKDKMYRKEYNEHMEKKRQNGVLINNELILKREIEKKDKLIDLMVDRFQQICVTPELAKYQWKRICSQDLKICEGRLCEDCIKQYFENKVEGSK